MNTAKQLQEALKENRRLSAIIDLQDKGLAKISAFSASIQVISEMVRDRKFDVEKEGFNYVEQAISDLNDMMKNE